jgi:hypothetical protein
VGVSNGAKEEKFKMKCELCGAEWTVWAGSLNPVHSESNCPLSGMTLPQCNDIEINAINTAIRQTRVERDPEKCRYYKKRCLKQVKIGWYHPEWPSVPDHYEMLDACPCAAWKEK